MSRALHSCCLPCLHMVPDAAEDPACHAAEMCARAASPPAHAAACKFDLRFVPEEQSFEGRQVRDEATDVPTGR